MKKTFPLLVFLITLQCFAQTNQKDAFQKSKYDLAVSYYKKSDFVKAIDLFSLVAKIKPENEIGQEAIKKVDTLREVLRKEILDNAIGTWKKSGNRPVWATASSNVNQQSDFDEIVEISENEIVFYSMNKKTKEKKLLKKEDLIYNDANGAASLFSEIILSDGTIWNCSVNDKADVLHVINVAVKTEDGIEKIKSDNEESYYVKM
ncbi:hypothetical protein NYQ10_21600 [Flavobacterium johnsoniae]|uniref:hypothetical protein n=1 Tax=Flavobacterium johnsoniae TaxID=986 RepID=UPI0025B27DD6|nr:hypothetical protein [Flavobacterium johnsoniae]WJS94679.1 hypothetical protein NYQ10_21600 [Flavobacterium johnsoniae]